MKYSIWGRGEPREGFLPLVVGIIIIGLSVIIMLQAFLVKAHEEGKVFNKKENKNFIDTFRMPSYVILMALYGVLLESIGFLITSTVFMTLILKVVEKRSWMITVLVGLGTTITSYFLFKYFLNVPLPEGLIKW
jgi:putative tricarboxylic transport membrane protein